MVFCPLKKHVPEKYYFCNGVKLQKTFGIFKIFTECAQEINCLIVRKFGNDSFIIVGIFSKNSAAGKN